MLMPFSGLETIILYYPSELSLPIAILNAGRERKLFALKKFQITVHKSKTGDTLLDGLGSYYNNCRIVEIYRRRGEEEEEWEEDEDEDEEEGEKENIFSSNRRLCEIERVEESAFKHLVFY